MSVNHPPSEVLKQLREKYSDEIVIFHRITQMCVHAAVLPGDSPDNDRTLMMWDIYEETPRQEIIDRPWKHPITDADDHWKESNFKGNERKP